MLPVWVHLCILDAQPNIIEKNVFIIDHHESDELFLKLIHSQI